MLLPRIIPILLISKRRVVKTTQFRKPSYVGDPINVIRIFNEKEVDELVVLDIDASKNQIEPDFEYIEQLAGECFMPLTYGGGIKSVDQAATIFSSGVEKVSIQSATINDASLIQELTNRFGSQSIVASLDVNKGIFGQYRVVDTCRGRKLPISVLSRVQELSEAGVGEILLNAVHKDGTLSGIDEPMIHLVSSNCSLPVIATGGVGSLKDIRRAFDAGASAVGVGAFFVYHGPHRAVIISYPTNQQRRNLGIY